MSASTIAKRLESLSIDMRAALEFRHIEIDQQVFDL